MEYFISEKKKKLVSKDLNSFLELVRTLNINRNLGRNNEVLNSLNSVADNIAILKELWCNNLGRESWNRASDLEDNERFVFTNLNRRSSVSSSDIPYEMLKRLKNTKPILKKSGHHRKSRSPPALNNGVIFSEPISIINTSQQLSVQQSSSNQQQVQLFNHQCSLQQPQLQQRQQYSSEAVVLPLDLASKCDSQLSDKPNNKLSNDQDEKPKLINLVTRSSASVGCGTCNSKVSSASLTPVPLLKSSPFEEDCAHLASINDHQFFRLMRHHIRFIELYEDRHHPYYCVKCELPLHRSYVVRHVKTNHHKRNVSGLKLCCNAVCQEDFKNIHDGRIIARIDQQKADHIKQLLFVFRCRLCRNVMYTKHAVLRHIQYDSHIQRTISKCKPI